MVEKLYCKDCRYCQILPEEFLSVVQITDASRYNAECRKQPPVGVLSKVTVITKTTEEQQHMNLFLGAYPLIVAEDGWCGEGKRIPDLNPPVTSLHYLEQET